MSLLYNKPVKCALCGESSDQTFMISTSQFGSPDLDMRPPQPQRSTMHQWIQCCPDCGYCSPDITEIETGIAEIVRAVTYQDQFKSQNYNQLANSFRCYSRICESSSNFSDAGWSYLHAAWVCDDYQNFEGSINCRKESARLFLTTNEMDLKFHVDKDTEDAIMLDVLRRSGQFEKALKLSEKVLQREPTEIMKKIMNFHMALIDNQDMACYTIDDAAKP